MEGAAPSWGRRPWVAGAITVALLSASPAGATRVVRVRAETQPLHPALAGWYVELGARPPLHRAAPLTPRQGAAFAADDHHVVTAAHTVVGAASIAVDGDVERPARVVAWDRAADLALLDVDVGPAAARRSPVEGERVSAWGFPGGASSPVQVEGAMLGGIELQRADATPGPRRVMWSTELVVRPGFSGSPVVGADGAVVAVVTRGKRTDGKDEGPAFAMDASAIEGLVPGGGPLLDDGADGWRARRAVWGAPEGAALAVREAAAASLRGGGAAAVRWQGRWLVAHAGG